MATDFFQKNKSVLQGAHAVTLEQARGRLVLVAMILMMGYLAVGVRLADLTFKTPPKEAQTAAVRQDPALPAKTPRGSIVDRNGNLMAASLNMASVYADTTRVDVPEILARELAEILPEQSYDDLLQKLSSGKKFVWIQRNITPKQEYAINAIGDPAVGFQKEARRIYPAANLTAHITGYTDLDGKGIAGLEKYFDEKLSKTGEDLQLTIDLRVQHMMHQELGKAVKKFKAKAGTGMVMDVDTGEIIAMVSLPDFDPNHVGQATDAEKFNRATLGVFEMGSTFKLFSVAAALDSGLVKMGNTFDATEPIKMGRFTISDFHALHRPLTVPEIFIYSSNIGTSKMSEKLGNERVQAFYKALGFNAVAPVELPEKGKPLYPTPWRDISTLTTSFGHGIAISPLHLMRAASALVNGGTLPRSTLVKPDRPLSLAPEGETVASPRTSHQMRQLLELTVVSGTGDKAHVDGYNVGGKTGTAEKNRKGGYEENNLLSSFLGVFPIHNPRYAVLAILDEPKGTADTRDMATGGWTAAPVVARVIEQMGPLYGIAPDFEHSPKDIEREMAVYLKDLKEGSRLASAGTDH